MQSNSTQLGPAWTFYSDIWLGRAVCKDKRTGHVRTVPHRDPAQAMQEVCTVLWDDTPWQPEDILASTLRSYLMPMFVKDPALVPPKVLQLQSKNWYLQNINLFADAGNAGQTVVNTATYHTDDEGSIQHSRVSGNGRCGRASGGSVASNFSTPAKKPTVEPDTWQSISSDKKGAVCNHQDATVCKPASVATQVQPDSFSVAGLPPVWLKRLIQEHLEPSDRLYLFQTNKAMAAAVMHHAIRSTLCLIQKTPRRDLHVQCKPAVDIWRSLTSFANNNLHVHVDESTFSQLSSRRPSSLSPRQFVTQLTLSVMVLRVEHLLQLKAYSNLKMLTFGPYLQCYRANSNEKAQLSELDSWLPTSCTKLQLSQEGTLTCIQRVVPLMAPRITHLIIQPTATDEQTEAESQLKKLVTHQLPDFTALTHIAVPWSLTGEEPLLGALVSLSTLTHVVADWLGEPPIPDANSWDGTEVHSRHLLNVNWQQLVFREDCIIGALTQLPLDRIWHVKIHGGVYPKLRWPAQMTDWHIAELATCPHLQLLPAVFTVKGYRWQVEQGTHVLEQLCLPMLEFGELYTKEFVQVCIRSLVGGVMLDNFGGKVMADFVRILPPTVDAVCFIKARAQTDREGSCEQLVTALPKHVKKLIMENPGDGRELCRNAALIAKYLTTTGHPAVLYVLLSSHQPVLPELQQAVAAYPNNVRGLIGEAEIRWSTERSKPQLGLNTIWQDG